MDEMGYLSVKCCNHRIGMARLGDNGANLAVLVLIQVGLDLGLPVPASPRMAAWAQILT